MSEPVNGLVVAHGSLAEGLVEAVRQITGLPQGALTPLSNAGRSPEELARAIGERLRGGAWIVFSDLPVGSCTFTARRLCRGRRDVAIITGVNLPMLLDFAVNRELPLEELAERMIVKGQQGICGPSRDERGDARRAV